MPRGSFCEPYKDATTTYIPRSRCTHWWFMSSEVPTYEKVAVEQVLLLASWTRHRTITSSGTR